MKEILKLQKEYYKLNYTKSVTYRETQLKILKKSLKENEEKLKAALYLDLNKSSEEAYITELFMIYKSINHMLKNLSKYSKDQKVKTPLILKPAKSYIRKVPYGNALIMNAYNYPLLLSIDPLIGSIAAGNTTMLALSKNSSNTNKVLIEILNEVFPKQYIYAFETDRNINSELLSLDFDKIFFTGSKKVGQIVLEAASKKLINTTLELGGKSPSIILRDANIKKAVSDIVYSKVLNAGQTCIATDYILVDDNIADEVVSEIKLVYKKFYPDLKDFGKIVNEKEYNRLKNIIESDEDYLINEVDFNDEDHKFSLALLETDSENYHDLASMQSENFGPILPIIRYKDFNDIFKVVSNFEVPLALYIFGKRISNIYYLLNNIEAGGVSINTTVLHMVNENLPFSGFKSSGLGSYHGKYSYEAFSYSQAVYKKGFLNLHKIIYPPYKLRKK